MAERKPPACARELLCRKTQIHQDSVESCVRIILQQPRHVPKVSADDNLTGGSIIQPLAGNGKNRCIDIQHEKRPFARKLAPNFICVSAFPCGAIQIGSVWSNLQVCRDLVQEDRGMYKLTHLACKAPIFCSKTFSALDR